MMQKTLDVRRLLRRLEGATAGSLESETLEFKRWDGDSRSMWRKVRESVVALANQSGGYLVLGVEDRTVGRGAISGVPDIDLGELVRKVHDGTDPGILVEAEELEELGAVDTLVDVAVSPRRPGPLLQKPRPRREFLAASPAARHPPLRPRCRRRALLGQWRRTSAALPRCPRRRQICRRPAASRSR